MRDMGVTGVQRCALPISPVLTDQPPLPVTLAPSHATGKRSLVPAVARAGVAVGADGLIVEAHPAPERAISDGAQSLDLNQFRKKMEDIKPYITPWEEATKKESLAAPARETFYRRM